jgi:hypothetical protein
MKELPRKGPWIAVYWRDASANDEWVDNDDESPRTIEVSVGMLMGVTSDEKVRLVPTVAVQLEPEKLKLKLSELEIPIGCIVHIERLPDADVHRAVNAAKSAATRRCHFVPPATPRCATKRPKTLRPRTRA